MSTQLNNNHLSPQSFYQSPRSWKRNLVVNTQLGAWLKSHTCAVEFLLIVHIRWLYGSLAGEEWGDGVELMWRVQSWWEKQKNPSLDPLNKDWPLLAPLWNIDLLFQTCFLLYNLNSLQCGLSFSDSLFSLETKGWCTVSSMFRPGPSPGVVQWCVKLLPVRAKTELLLPAPSGWSKPWLVHHAWLLFFSSISQCFSIIFVNFLLYKWRMQAHSAETWRRL